MGELTIGDKVIEVSGYTQSGGVQMRRRIATIKRIEPQMNLILLDNNARYNLSDGQGRIGYEYRWLTPLTPEEEQEIIEETLRPARLARLNSINWDDYGDVVLGEVLIILDCIRDIPAQG